MDKEQQIKEISETYEDIKQGLEIEKRQAVKELSEFRPICKFEGKDAICALFCPNWKYDGGLFFECTRKVDRSPQS